MAIIALALLASLGLQEPTVGEILDQWAAGAAKIDSYALQLDLDATSYLKQGEDRQVRVVPEEKAMRMARVTSRIWRSGEKRRGEFGQGGGTDTPETVMTFDGRTLSKRSGGARQITLEVGTAFFGVIEYEDYDALYRTIRGTYDRIGAARSRASKLLPRDGRLYVVETPASGKGDYGNVGWKVWLDPERNFLPVRIAQWLDNGQGTGRDRDIEVALIEVERGVWAPMQGTITVYGKSTNANVKDKVIMTGRLTVDAEKSKFNVKVPDDLFDPKIRTGDTVVDKVRNVTYKQGAGDPEAYLDKIAEQAGRTAGDMRARYHDQPLAIPPDGPAYLKWSLAILATTAVLATGFRVYLARAR